MDFPKIDGIKYNSWCERKVAVGESQEKISKAFQFAARKDLSKSEGSAFFLHELTGCDGFEFVAFSDSKLHKPLRLKNGIIIVPCFLTNMDGTSLNDPIAQKTFEMERYGRFVYDCWLPISDWSVENVKKSIKSIDKALSFFSLKIGTYFEWLPKYEAHDMPSTYLFTDEHIDELELLNKRVEKLTDEDQDAFYRSLGWFSQSFRLKEPSAKFLFFILTIESFATYIEKYAKENSILKKLRANTMSYSDNKTKTIECIKEYFEKSSDNQIEGIKQAYLNCIEKGSTQTLKDHISKLFGSDSNSYKLLFEKQNDTIALYKLRHKIAHGDHNAINEIEREYIVTRLNDAENLARSYLLKVIKESIGLDSFSTQFLAEITISVGNMVVTNEARVNSPSHMAIIYG